MSDDPMKEVEDNVEKVLAPAMTPTTKVVDAKIGRGEWLNPLNRIIWQTAFRAKAKSMTLRNGDKFNLTYEEQSGTLKVWVQSATYFVPAGWFDYNMVISKEWVTSG